MGLCAAYNAATFLDHLPELEVDTGAERPAQDVVLRVAGTRARVDVRQARSTTDGRDQRRILVEHFPDVQEQPAVGVIAEQRSQVPRER